MLSYEMMIGQVSVLVCVYESGVGTSVCACVFAHLWKMYCQ